MTDNQSSETDAVGVRLGEEPVLPETATETEHVERALIASSIRTIASRNATEIERGCRDFEVVVTVPTLEPVAPGL